MGLKARGSLAGRMKLARLFTLDDEAYAGELAALESEKGFGALKAAGVLSLNAFSKSAFAARRFPGWRLGPPAEGAGELLDGASREAELLKRIGPERLKECFLEGSGLSRAEKARRSGIGVEEAKRIEEFLTRLWVQEELGGAAPAAPSVGFSVVAGFVIEDGRPALRFFHREAWKGRWRVDQGALRVWCGSRPPEEAAAARRLASALEFTDRRKTTLLKVLEAVMEAQKGWLLSGDPADMVPLTQRSVAAAVGSDPSVVNRLAANKAVELPWGTEAPLKQLMPSSKDLGKNVLAALAMDAPTLSDEALRTAMAERGYALSRRSIAQYRVELGLGAKGTR
ncbi:MAG: RNA polymerase sigma-54 factor [Elusimicrobia bacterium]|nr:MAG: RNA polymerase sigma-54 factor [Elusimicrobiota bacterium]